MAVPGMRQVEERHVASRIESMVWCDRVDLLALSNTRGEVQVHRLNWQRVWSLPPSVEGSTVRGMAWRPDGKVLAIGYSCGRVSIVDVENKDILYSFQTEVSESIDNGVTFITWSQRAGISFAPLGCKTYDDPSVFLPRLPTLNPSYINKKNEESVTENRQLRLQDNLNMLIVCYGFGKLHLSVFGQFACGVIDVRHFIRPMPEEVTIVNVLLSDDYSLLRICFLDKSDNHLKVILLDTEILSAYSEELYTLATKHCHIVSLMSYVDQTMTSIIEGWEQILLEMDAKLAKYASLVPKGAVSADLLDLLMLGVPTDELELFLLQDLTAKGLKKFGSSIELSYSTIQKLVLQQLNTVGQNLTYHLAELRGYARIKHRFKVLGLEETAVSFAISASSAFLNKCFELQQVIDQSMKNYKAFFRWLYVVIVRMMDEHIPSEIVKITQQDLCYIAEFLQNFDRVGDANNSDSDDKSPRSRKFNLERLGQYLVNKELTIPPDDEDNTWIKFLKDNPCCAADEAIIPNFKNYSLIQQQGYLKTSVGKVFDFADKVLSTQISALQVLNFSQIISDEKVLLNDLRVTQINSPSDECIYVAFSCVQSSNTGFYFVEMSTLNNVLSTRCVYFYFEPSSCIKEAKLETSTTKFRVLDLQFYSSEVLSILLGHQEEEISMFVQFPVRTARHHCKLVPTSEKGIETNLSHNIPKVEACAVLEQGLCKVLEKLSGFRIAVSGGRKVSVVLSRSCRKIKIFEMEVDGEDDEEDEVLDTTPRSSSTNHNSDTSQNFSLTEIMQKSACLSFFE